MGAAETVMVALGVHPVRSAKMPVPNHGWVVSEDYRVSSTVAEPLVRQLLPAGVIKKEDADLRILYLLNGSSIGFKSCDSGPEKFAGASRNWIWFDEEPDEAVYRECLARTIDCKGDMWITMTPLKGRSSWTFEKIYERWQNGEYGLVGGVPELDVMEVTIFDNPYIDKDEIERARKQLPKHEIESRIYGRYATAEGLVFPEFSPIVHVQKHALLPKPQASWIWRIGMDHGAGHGHTAAYWGGLREDSVLQVCGEYYNEKGVGAFVHAAGVRQLVTPGWPMPTIFLDRTAKQVQIELACTGLSVTEANNDVQQGFARIREYMAEDDSGLVGLVISDRCPRLIRDLQRYHWVGATAKSEDKDRPRKKSDHSVDAFRYLCQSMPRQRVLYRNERGLSIQEKEARHIEAMLTREERMRKKADYGHDGMG
ncbi:MAG: hypothetical protein AABY75_05495 [Bacteroidota bacterium]